MPDSKQTAAPAPAPDTTAPKKKSRLPLFAGVGALMAAEAAAVFVIAKITGAPQAAHAHEVVGHEHAAAEAPVELLFVTDRFQNVQTGKVWIWKVEAHLKVKASNESAVSARLGGSAAEVTERVGQIVRRAQHNQLTEPDLRTLNRQLVALAKEVLGTDAEGQPLFDRVMISKCEGFPAD